MPSQARSPCTNARCFTDCRCNIHTTDHFTTFSLPQSPPPTTHWTGLDASNNSPWLHLRARQQVPHGICWRGPMTPHPDSHLAQDRSSTSSSFRNSSSVWSANTTTSAAQQTSNGHGLAPLSTAFTSSTRPGSSSHSPRNPWSPTNATSTANSASRNPTRSSSISTSTSPFSPPAAYHPPPGLPSARTRTFTSASNSTASAAASSNNARLSRASPSIPHGSSSSSSTPIGFEQSPSSSVSSIVIAQITVLLSSLKERDKVKWESQVDQIRKVTIVLALPAFTHAPDMC